MESNKQQVSRTFSAKSKSRRNKLNKQSSFHEMIYKGHKSKLERTQLLEKNGNHEALAKLDNLINNTSFDGNDYEMILKEKSGHIDSKAANKLLRADTVSSESHTKV